LVDIIAADLIILPFKPGTLSSSALSAIIDPTSFRACHARLLISHQYITRCAKQKAQLHIKDYRIDLLAPIAAPKAEPSEDRAHGFRSRRTSDNWTADLRTPESMTDRRPRVHERADSGKRRDEKQQKGSREVERKVQQDLRFSSSEEDESESEEKDELDSTSDLDDPVPLKSEIKSRSSSSPPPLRPARPAVARQRPRDVEESTVRPEDEADYQWLKRKIGAWNFVGSRVGFLESLTTAVSTVI
jgi:hypothetical protein